MLAGAAGLAFSLLAQSVPAIVIGVLIAEVFVALHITETIARLVRPVTRFAHLCDEAGASFMLAFVSPSAANAMLVDFYQKDTLDRTELILASLLNSFPSIVMHWRVLLPVYIPLLGTAGLIYFLLLTTVGFFKSGLIMLVARLLLPGRSQCDPAVPHAQRTPLSELPREVFSAARAPLRRILVITVPTILLVALLIELGVFDWLADVLEGATRLFPVPAEGLGIIAAQFANFVAAASVASPLYYSGAISTRDLVITLLAGNVLSSVTRSFRWLGSYYIAIFGPRLGTEIMVISTAMRNGLMVILIFVLARIWQ
ncbi:MAG: nucleoside recognition protein [Methanomicrobiaceae archaeon]|nr:nucleoside recognition protein [Methanomicrobiaceae archaeon]